VRSVPFAGVSPGAPGEPQYLLVTANSDNPAVIPDPVVTYTSPGSNGTLTLLPLAVGTANIAVTVNDGGPVNPVVTRILNVNVIAPPTLSPLADLTVFEDSGPQTVPLSGIRAGPSNEVQILTVTASSSRPELIPHPTVTYQSPQSAGSLSLQPATNAFGTATVSVVVYDGASSLGSVTQSFQVVVLDRNDPPVISPIPDRSTPEDAPVLVGFVISDLESAPGSLIVTASSSDPALIPASGLSLAGTNGDRALWIQPATNRTGSATITVTVADAAGGTNRAQFQLTVTPVDDPLVVLAPPAQATLEDTPTPPLAFTLWDPDSPVTGIGVRALSSNPALVPLSGIQLGGTGSNRTIQLFPATNQAGSTVITLIASNGLGGETVSSFLLTVQAVEDPPFLSVIPDLTLLENTVSAPISFVVGDVETPSANLNVSADSSNPALLPAAQITWAGAGSNRTLRLAPLPNRFGLATVTVTVTDGGGLATYRTFLLTVLEVPDPPSILTNPVGASVSFGTPVELAVTAAGTGPLLYQWFRDGMAVPGATNRVLALPGARPADAGIYRVQVRNSAGTATSAAATLEVQGQLTASTILSVTRTGGAVEITFSTSRNSRCLVEFRAEADTGPWSVLTTVTGTGGTLTVADPSPLAPRRFYRVREE
jgi:hypothetical protein